MRVTGGTTERIRFLAISVFVALGFFVVQEGGMLARIYEDWHSSLDSEDMRGMFPARFLGPVQYIVLGAWLLAVLGSYIGLTHLTRGKDLPYYFRPEFYHQIASFSQRYFHERIHELEKDTLRELVTRTEGHDRAVVKALYALRDALNAGYKSDMLRVTLMRPEMRDRDSEEQLYIIYWANASWQTPISRKEKIAFRKGEGFAGHAWEDRVPQMGGKTKWFVFPEPRYKKTSSDQDVVRSFCSIPIFNEGPSEDGRPLLGVLNIDATGRFYFPIRQRTARAFCSALRPLIMVLVLHMTWIDILRASAQQSDDASGQKNSALLEKGL